MIQLSVKNLASNFMCTEEAGPPEPVNLLDVNTGLTTGQENVHNWPSHPNNRFVAINPSSDFPAVPQNIYLRVEVPPPVNQEVRDSPQPELLKTELAKYKKFQQCLEDNNLGPESQVVALFSQFLEDLDAESSSPSGFNYPWLAVRPPDILASVGEPHELLGFSFGHGILSTVAATQKYVDQVSEYTGGYQVNARHWQYMVGLSKHRNTAQGKLNPNVVSLVDMFNHHFDTKGESAPYIHICHSEGANDADLALKQLSDKRKKQMNFICVGPAKFIDANECGSVRSLVSEHDLVPQFSDPQGLRRAKEVELSIIDCTDHNCKNFLKAHAFMNEIHQEKLAKEVDTLMKSLLQANE
ncbi:MAG: hypothetical protein S4CHLAM7_08520 [Chlamydiae bacterium]|nr:hypothetical protein [Chlamydiota bacterium]